MRQETPAPKGAGVSLFFHLRCALGGLALEVDVVELIRDLLHKELLQVDVGADLTEEEEELEALEAEKEALEAAEGETAEGTETAEAAQTEAE